MRSNTKIHDTDQVKMGQCQSTIISWRLPATPWQEYTHTHTCIHTPKIKNMHAWANEMAMQWTCIKSRINFSCTDDALQCNQLIQSAGCFIIPALEKHKKRVKQSLCVNSVEWWQNSTHLSVYNYIIYIQDFCDFCPFEYFTRIKTKSLISWRSRYPFLWT